MDEEEKKATPDQETAETKLDAQWETAKAAPVEEEAIDPGEDSREVLEKLGDLDAHLVKLEKLFSDRIANTEYEDKVVDRMHDELQGYKEDMYLKIMRPLINSVIEVRNSIQRNAAMYRAKQQDSVPLSTYESYAYDIQDALEKCNVELVHDESGVTFDPKTMSVLKLVNTPAPELDRKVAEVVTDGYRYEDKILAREKVYAFKYVPEEKKEEDGKVEQ